MKLSSTGLAIELTPEESELFSALPSYAELATLLQKSTGLTGLYTSIILEI
jgi:hypothetical protein